MKQTAQYLIRPDGHIEYECGGTDLDDLQHYLAHWLPIVPYDGRGSCYIEFGAGLIGKVDADFLSGPSPKAPFLGPSRELAGEKDRFISTAPALVRRLSAGGRWACVKRTPAVSRCLIVIMARLIPTVH